MFDFGGFSEGPPLLTVMTVLPVLVALGLAIVPSPSDTAVRIMALGATLVELALAVVVWWRFETPVAPQLAMVESVAWIMPLGIRYTMGLDGISLAMIALTALLSPMAVLCSWNSIKDRVREYHVALLLLVAGMIGVFCAADLFLFYVFWEVMLLPMALMIGIWGGPRRRYAAMKFMLYTMAGSLLMFVAIVYCGWIAAEGPGGPTFDIVTLQKVLPGVLPRTAQLWLFAAFALSFAIKVPMFPFHTWLPDAHVEAPTAGSVILAGVLLKMGSYGFLRFAIPFFPIAAAELAPGLMVVSAIGIVYGSLMSMTQTDIKKLIAYSSVAHLGFTMLGIFSGDVAGAQGGVLQMVNHGVSTGALFLLVGVVYERTHTRGVGDFGGLAQVMPVYATMFFIVAMSSIGLPGLNGFVGEFLVLLGAFQAFPMAAAAGGLGVVLGAVYMLTMYKAVFFGAGRPEQKGLADPDAFELASLVPLLALIVVLGVAPNLVLSVTEAPVAHVMKSLAPPGVVAQHVQVHP